MTKQRLIKRFKMLYVLEKFHALVSFPALLIYVLYTNPLKNVILLSYGLIVCIIILYQGQLYWKLKLHKLIGKGVDQARHIQYFKKSKSLNWILIAFIQIVFLIQLYVQDWVLNSNDMMIWAVLANLFAILEHINYYYKQLMIDNLYDLKYFITHKKFKMASLAKDLVEGEI